jgi:hypothetical protein
LAVKIAGVEKHNPEAEPQDTTDKDNKGRIVYLSPAVRSYVYTALATVSWVIGAAFLNSHPKPVFGAWAVIFLGVWFFSRALRLWLINHRNKHPIHPIAPDLWSWVIVGTGLLGCSWAIWQERPETVEIPKPAPAQVQNPWRPPELPKGCTNVTLYFGGTTLSMSIFEARISASGNGTRFALKDVPQKFTDGIDKLTNYSPRNRDLWIRRLPRFVMGDKEVELPVAPVVVSNRLYVEAELPFKNDWRTVLMSDDLDQEFPKLWDRNYDSNRYELVTERGNPVFQLIYEAANRVRVNTIFLIDTNTAIGAFGTNWQSVSVHAMVVPPDITTNVLPLSIVVAPPWLKEIYTNLLYNKPFPGQERIFRYPSWKYPGILEPDARDQKKRSQAHA